MHFQKLGSLDFFFKSLPIPANSSSSESCHYLLKFTISLAFTQINTLLWEGCQSCQGLTQKLNKNFDNQIFVRKKTDVKVQYENSWKRKGSEEQKYSSDSWNFKNTIWTQRVFYHIWKVFFVKDWKKFYFQNTKFIKKKCQFTNFWGEFWQTSRPVCYFSF